MFPKYLGTCDHRWEKIPNIFMFKIYKCKRCGDYKTGVEN